MKKFFILAIAFSLSACQTFKKPSPKPVAPPAPAPVAPAPTPTPAPAPKPTPAPVASAPLVALSWEKKVESRKEWSQYVYDTIDIKVFDSAKDMARICTSYAQLNEAQKKTVVAELFSAMAFYESGWDQKSASVDVGNKDKRDTWSIGLLQISVVDQEWAGIGKLYNYDQLLTAKPNLHLAIAILQRQIKKAGLVILDNSSKYRYWAVLLDGNKYSKVSSITAMTQKLPFCAEKK